MNSVEKAATQAGLNVTSNDDHADFAIIDVNGDPIVFRPLENAAHNMILEAGIMIDIVWRSGAVWAYDCPRHVSVKLPYEDDDMLGLKFRAVVELAAKLYDSKNDE